MNSPVKILTRFIYLFFFCRSNTDLNRRFPIDWPTCVWTNARCISWTLPLPNLVSSPPAPESVRAGADECTLASKENFLASIAMEASRGRKFRYIHLLHSAYLFTYNFYFDFYSCLLPCFLCTFNNEDFSVSTNYFCSCIVTDIH